MDAAVRRSDIRCVSIRPSWVQHEGNYERNLGPQIRDGQPGAGLWSYIDAYDLADAIVLATESDLPGHEVFYIASPDNVGGHDFATALREHYGDAIALRRSAVRTPPASPARRRCGCSAGRPSARGATTWTRTAGR